MKTKTLSDYLIEHGLSQAAFGEMIGRSQGTVWRMTQGLHLERRKTRNLIFEATNGEVDVWAESAPARRVAS